VRKRKEGTPQPKSKRPGGKALKKSVQKFAAESEDDDVKLNSEDEGSQRSGSGSDYDLDEQFNSPKAPDGKRKGTKWLAKQQAKEEKKKRLEQEKKDRAEAKKKEEEEYQERKRLEQEEEDKERAAEAERQKLLEIKRQKEEEEYQQMAAAFEIEEEGEENTEEAMESEKEVLARFVAYVKEQKIIMIDELASQFSLKTPDCIERLKSLLEDDTLSGVIDDRGKFIYVTPEELRKTADFIKNKGRVSKLDLSRNSGLLIDLPKS